MSQGAWQADDWHSLWLWLWEAYVGGMFVAVAARVLMLDHRFPGNVSVTVTALAGIVVCVLAFGRRIIRADEFDWRSALFLAAIIGLWVIALSASRWRRPSNRNWITTPRQPSGTSS
jgi:hypothetical protein